MVDGTALLLTSCQFGFSLSESLEKGKEESKKKRAKNIVCLHIKKVYCKAEKKDCCECEKGQHEEDQKKVNVFKSYR